jgi:hypothetical protein
MPLLLLSYNKTLLFPSIVFSLDSSLPEHKDQNLLIRIIRDFNTVTLQSPWNPGKTRLLDKKEMEKTAPSILRG